MKTKSLIFLPICFLLLTGCGSKHDGNTTSLENHSATSEIVTSESVSNKTETSKTEQETSKVESESTQVESQTTESSETATESLSETTIESSTETETQTEITTSIEKPNWSSQDLALMKEHLDGQIVPYIPIEGASWAYSEDIGSITYRKVGGKDADCQIFFDELMTYEEAIDIYGDDGEPGFYREVDYACSETVSLRLVIYSYSNQFVVDTYLYDYLTVWPEAIIDEEILYLTGKTIDLIAPSFQASKYYAATFISDVGEYLEILAFSEPSCLTTYVEQLTAAGYVLEVSDYYDYYVDPSNTISVTVTYLDSLNCLYLAVEPYYSFE